MTTPPLPTTPAARPEARGSARTSPEGNGRLTALTGVVLLVLLAAEGVTVLQVGALLTPHVFIGMLLVPPVLVKIGTTTWRAARYYLGDGDYRRKGPPPLVLRLLGPFEILLTVTMFASGIALLYVPSAWRFQLLFVHRASFVLWFCATTVHVLGHLIDTASTAPKDFLPRTRRRVPGATARTLTLVASLAAGVALAAVVTPQASAWIAGPLGH